MTKTDKTSQNVLNELNSSMSTQFTEQEIANILTGNPKTGLSFQEVLNVQKGNSVKTEESAQSILFQNIVGAGVELQGTNTDYSEQELLNIAIQNDLTLEQVISGEELTLSEYIKSLSGLVAYYPLDESSGNAINQAPDTLGTLDGTVTGATQNVDGLVGKAYSFDGVNDVIDVGTVNGMFANLSAGSYGVGFLVKTEVTTSKSVSGYSDGSGSEGFLARLNQNSSGGTTSGTIGVFIRDKDNVFKNISPTSTPNPSVNDNNWHFCYLQGTPSSSSSTAHKWFIDGLPVATTLQNTNIVDNWDGPSGGKFGLGGEFDQSGNLSSNGFTGSLQHYFFVNELLDDAAVLRIAQLAGLA